MLSCLVDASIGNEQQYAWCRFLRMCPGLSRQLIGDLLGENNERCLRVLERFTASFDFRGASPRAVNADSFNAGCLMR